MVLFHFCGCETHNFSMSTLIKEVLYGIEAMTTKCFDILADYESSETSVEENRKELNSLLHENEQLKKVIANNQERVTDQDIQIKSLQENIAKLLDDKTRLIKADTIIYELKYEVA